MVIISINPIQSVFWLVIVFLFTGCLLITLNINYISLLMVIIYIGAIAILFLFVIMMLDILQIKKINSIENILPITFIFMVTLLTQSWIKINNNVLYTQIKNWNFNNLDHIFIISKWLYNDQSFIIIIISLLLLISMVGAIVLTLELSLITKRQILIEQQQRNNSWT